MPRRVSSTPPIVAVAQSAKVVAMLPLRSINDDSPCAFALADTPYDVECVKLPHLMGTTAMPTFTARPTKGIVRVSDSYQTFSGPDDASCTWDYLGLPLLDSPTSGSLLYDSREN